MAQKETDMGRNIPGHRLDKFRQSPSLFLAYCGIRRALKKATLLEMIGKGLVIFIAPTGYRQSDYCTAARYLFEGIPEFDWVENNTRIRTALPSGQNGRTEDNVSVFDLGGLAVLIAADIEEVPPEVRFAAVAVLPIEAPSPAQIQGARRLAGKPPITDETAALLATKPQNLLLAAIARHTLDDERHRMLDSIESVSSQGPNLFELPGYDSLKEWARQIANDVDLCRRGKLAWKVLSSWSARRTSRISVILQFCGADGSSSDSLSRCQTGTRERRFSTGIRKRRSNSNPWSKLLMTL